MLIGKRAPERKKGEEDEAGEQLEAFGRLHEAADSQAQGRQPGRCEDDYAYHREQGESGVMLADEKADDEHYERLDHGYGDASEHLAQEDGRAAQRRDEDGLEQVDLPVPDEIGPVEEG